MATDPVFAGSIPEIYDRYLVPLIFESYAIDLAQRIALTDPATVLETAAGTGVLTQTMASRLPEVARIVATDLNQQMLERAKARLHHDHRIEWKQSDALSLPFADQGFDVVACQFGVMFFPNKVQGYKEAHRVLKPGGRLVFNVWDRISQNQFADTVTEALATLFPNASPRFLARTPHGYHDIESVRADLSAAGFDNITVDTVKHISRASSPLDAAIAYCQGTPLRNEIQAQSTSCLEDATEQAAEALANRFGTGEIEGRIQAFAIIAIR